jgi:hypothetical protein
MKLSLALAALFALTAHAATDWSRFRGPNGSGVAETTGLPSVVDDSTTLWKVELRAAGPPPCCGATWSSSPPKPPPTSVR